MIELLIPFLTFVAVVSIGTGIALALTTRKRSLHPRLDATHGDMAMGAPQHALVRATGGLGRRFSLGRISDRLGRELTRAGYYRDSASATYLGVKLVTFMLGVMTALAVVIPLGLALDESIYAVAVTAVVFFFIPNVIVRLKRARRLREIRNHLPDAVDLLEICVTAGMGLDTAWGAVSDEIRRVCTTLADEMALVSLEVQLGATRPDAMRNMANRTGAAELSSLVAMLVQSQRFGTSIAEALRVFASSSREARSARAEMASERMAVKLLFPLIVFIFPVLLIVVVGPAVMALAKVLG